jgi:hypothetical protein
MMPPRHWPTRLLIVTLGWTSAGASGTAQAPPNPSPPTPRADTAAVSRVDISGTWEGEFRLDSAWRLPEPPSARSVRARLQFSPVGDATPATTSTRAVHPGTFSIDFTRFGFTLSTQEALGWSTRPDSMRAVLNPTVDHGLVQLHGTLRNDGSVAEGTWSYSADPGGARGTFTLRRTR